MDHKSTPYLQKVTEIIISQMFSSPGYFLHLYVGTEAVIIVFNVIFTTEAQRSQHEKDSSFSLYGRWFPVELNCDLTELLHPEIKKHKVRPSTLAKYFISALLSILNRMLNVRKRADRRGQHNKNSWKHSC